MIRLLERNIASIDRHLLLLAPPKAPLPSGLKNVIADTPGHARRLREMQQMRGGVYFSDGFVAPHQLAVDGAHLTPEDERSWHLLMLNSEQRVIASAWLLQHEEDVRFSDLRVQRCPLAQAPQWRDSLLQAVEADIALARREAMGYAEVGGWAVARQNRCTSSGLLLALATYSLSALLGGTLALTTANVMHSSAAILRRLGGAPLVADDQPLPSYFDPHYNSNIELLRFDSRAPNHKYAWLIHLLRDKLADVAVLTQETPFSSALPDAVAA